MKNQARPGAPELNPLLQDVSSLENDQISSGASISGAVFNISTTTVGAGIMSIPAAIKVLGIVPGFVVILAMAFLVDVSVEFMLRYTQYGKSTSYAGLVAESFGPSGFVAVQVCVTVTTLGCLIIYLIIIGDVLCGNQSGGVVHLGILQEWFGIHWWNSRAYALLFLVLCVMLPLASLRRMDSLKHSSAISIFLAVVFVIMCSTMAIVALFQGKTQRLRLLPDLGNQTSVLHLFTAVPVLSTAFGFQVLVHPIRAELRKPSDMSLAIRISLAVCVAIYFSIGFFGYLLFGDSITADILVNFDQNSGSLVGRIVNLFVRLSYATHIALVFPVVNFSLRANIDELLFAKERPVLGRYTLRFMFLTCSLLALTYILAIAMPNIWYFFQLIGSTTVVCISFIFPAAIVIRDVHGISTRKDKFMAVIVLVVAVLTSIIAIYTNLSSSIKDWK